jgi:hypothetical protein
MKSSIYPIRVAFTEAIQALGYPVYDRAKKVNDYPYCLVGEQTEQQNGDQGEFGQDATIIIDIVNGWQSDYGTKFTGDTIVNEILQSVLTKPHNLTIAGFDMPVLILEQASTAVDTTETHTIATTTLRFRLHVFEQAGNVITDDDGNILTDDSGNILITD